MVESFQFFRNLLHIDRVAELVFQLLMISLISIVDKIKDYK